MRLIGVFALILLTRPGWAMDMQVSAGSELFLWEEYKDGDRLLDERGLRHFVAIDADNWVNSNWQSDFAGRIYSGTVEYNGENQSGVKTEPTDTDYDGIRLEAGFSYYPQQHGGSGQTGLRMAVGGDTWRRNIHDSRTADGRFVSGYIENYTIIYGLLGVLYRDSAQWSLNLGVKYPFYTNEVVELKAIGYDSDVTLKPKGRLSLHADFGYQFTPNWGGQLYFDSYRFAKSDSVANFYQPEIYQEVFGAKVSFTF